MTDPYIGELIAWWEGGAENWFSRSRAFDAAFRTRFELLHQLAMAGDLGAWPGSPEGYLLLRILLDQFPRNAVRGTRNMYHSDDRALSVALRAVKRDFIGRLPKYLRFLPLAHSDALKDQDLLVAFHRRYRPSGLHPATRRYDIIAHFGQFPHRQPIFVRALNSEEIQYLGAGGFRG